MDRKRHKLLTECVSYFQDNLTVTWKLVHMCVEHEIFTIQEGTTIWHEESPLGKSLELIYCLRKKDNAAYYNFIKVLKQNPEKNRQIIEVLTRTIVTPDSRKADQETQIVLNNALGGMVKDEILHDLSCKLVHRQRFEEIKGTLAEVKKEVNILERELDELKLERQELTKEVNDLDKQRKRLLKSLDGQAYELDKYKELNKTYAEVIVFLEKQNEPARVENNFQEDDDILDETNERIKELEKEKEQIAEELEDAEVELKEALDNIERIRQDVLPSKPNATIFEIEEEILKMVQNRNLSKEKMKLQKDIETLKKTKIHLEKRVNNLQIENRRVGFDLRNAQAQLVRTTGKRSLQSLYFSKGTASQKQQLVPRQPFGDISKDESVRPKTPSRAKSAVTKYCVLCRKFTDRREDCLLHVNELVRGQWICCNQRSNGKGCCRAVHCYVKKDGDTKFTLKTFDGEKALYTWK